MEVIERRAASLAPVRRGAGAAMRPRASAALGRSRLQLVASIVAALVFIAVGVGSLIAHATSGGAPAPSVPSSVQR
jgi:hypothetical protein